MPGHDPDPLGVALQHHHRLRQGGLQSILRDLPDLDQRGQPSNPGQGHYRPLKPVLTMTLQSSEPLAITWSL